MKGNPTVPAPPQAAIDEARAELVRAIARADEAKAKASASAKYHRAQAGRAFDIVCRINDQRALLVAQLEALGGPLDTEAVPK